MGLRRQARETAIQIIYMCDMLGKWDAPTIELFYDNFAVSPSLQQYSRLLCLGVITNLSEIDEKITQASEHWSINRICRVDRAILRVATFEMLYGLGIPRKSAINEAIEISKSFSSEESPQFINGVLDHIDVPHADNPETAAPLAEDALVKKQVA
ncbi:MAG: transcription antitermination factor NusB [Deltaproteobacteria bacterium]|nr:transcription antitermination factor NusB [Deltaproteobacteria bacterium]